MATLYEVVKKGDGAWIRAVYIHKTLKAKPPSNFRMQWSFLKFTGLFCDACDHRYRREDSAQVMLSVEKDFWSPDHEWQLFGFLVSGNALLWRKEMQRGSAAFI